MRGPVFSTTHNSLTDILEVAYITAAHRITRAWFPLQRMRLPHVGKDSLLWGGSGHHELILSLVGQSVPMVEAPALPRPIHSAACS